MTTLMIQYTVEDFEEDESGLTHEQLKAVLKELDCSLNCSMIDEHIRSEFYELAEKMFPDVFGEVDE